MSIKVSKLIKEDLLENGSSVRGKKNTEALSYWKGLLNGYDEIATMDSIKDEIEIDETSNYLEIKIDEKTTKKLNDIAIENEVTINSIMESVWGTILHWYNRTEDVVFGKIVLNQNTRETSKLKEELLYNIIPCRVNTKKGMQIKDLLKEMQCQHNEGAKYSYCSLEEIKNEVKQGEALFNTLIAFLDHSSSERIQTDILQATLKTIEISKKYSVVIYTYVYKNHISIKAKYDPKSYLLEDINLLLQRIRNIFEQISKNASLLVEEIEIVTKEERKLILNEFNKTRVEYPDYKTVIELFEEQVEKSPESIALLYKDEKVTYKELNTKANQLAYKLKKYGTNPNDFVAIIAERGVEMIIAIYGIIKSGCAYVPIDPNIPTERIQYILRDCNPKAIVVYQMEIETDIPIIDLKDKKVFSGVSENPKRINKLDDLVYCIYTSGTSGNPKGVMIEHKSLFNHIKVSTKVLYQDDVRMTPLFTNYSFDFTITMIFVSMLYGGTLVVFKNEKDIVKYLNAGNSFSILKITPSLFSSIRMGLKGKPNIKNLVFGGEKLSKEIVDQACKIFSADTIIHNEYGPTETTVFVTENIINCQQKVIPIGKPIWNTQIYILDGDKLCGIKMNGELCVAGDGLARGYLNKPELTAGKFTKNPFGNGLIYRTGDLARWMPDGNIDILGRVDEQIKIHGFRIELEEIENILRNIDEIEDVAVIAREDDWGNKSIYAYVVSENQINIEKLRSQISNELPYYMMPSHFIQIKEIPLTRNGKLDKRKLYET